GNLHSFQRNKFHISANFSLLDLSQEPSAPSLWQALAEDRKGTPSLFLFCHECRSRLVENGLVDPPRGVQLELDAVTGELLQVERRSTHREECRFGLTGDGHGQCVLKLG